MSSESFQPSYRKACSSGLLEERIEQARRMLSPCTLCPRFCRVDRIKGKTGYCRTGRYAEVSSCGPHHGEEAVLSGTYGSGTVFFTHCNLLCSFCQNFDIAHEGRGHAADPEKLADMMISLQRQGVHNINFVTPTHVVPQIIEALPAAIAGGLHVPLVYNSGGYDRVAALRLLDGIVDIYMPDVKFFSSRPAERYCNAPDYPQVVQAALREMHRQVGDLEVDRHGYARRGLLVRHLVMPGGAAGTENVMRFLAESISPDTFVNIMPQYRPCGRSSEYPEIDRPVTGSEYRSACDAARQAGITRLDERSTRAWLP